MQIQGRFLHCLIFDATNYMSLVFLSCHLDWGGLRLLMGDGRGWNGRVGGAFDPLENESQNCSSPCPSVF